MVIAVAMDSREGDPLPWIDAAKPTYPTLIDREHRLAELYGIVNVPQAVWIDEAGRIVRPAESAGAYEGFRQMNRATREIKAGCVWVNDHIPIISEMPHGGYKASGFGKDMSTYSFEEYTQIKHVMFDNTAVARKDWHRTIFGDR